MAKTKILLESETQAIIKFSNWTKTNKGNGLMNYIIDTNDKELFSLIKGLKKVGQTNMARAIGSMMVEL